MREKIENLAPDNEYMQEDRKYLIVQKQAVLINELDKYIKLKYGNDNDKIEIFNKISNLFVNGTLSAEETKAIYQALEQYKFLIIDSFANCKKTYVAIGKRKVQQIVGEIKQ